MGPDPGKSGLRDDAATAADRYVDDDARPTASVATQPISGRGVHRHLVEVDAAEV
jgi:hypothetical protein